MTVKLRLPPEIYIDPWWGETELAEIPEHVLALVSLITQLRVYFADEADVWVIGDVFWCFDPNNPKARRAPDVMVVRGVDPKKPRRDLRPWNEGGAIPCFVLEIVSDSTADDDVDAKRVIYEEQGVKEYFLFDPLLANMSRPLVGYRLIARADHEPDNGVEVEYVYEELQPGNDGGLVSSQLALRFQPEGSSLRLFSLRTGEELLAPDRVAEVYRETLAELLAVRERNDQEVRRADQQTRRADQLQRRLEDAERRAEEQRAGAAEARVRTNEALTWAAQEQAKAVEARAITNEAIARANAALVRANEAETAAAEERTKAAEARVRTNEALARANDALGRASQAESRAAEERAIVVEQAAARLAAEERIRALEAELERLHRQTPGAD